MKTENWYRALQIIELLLWTRSCWQISLDFPFFMINWMRLSNDVASNFWIALFTCARESLIKSSPDTIDALHGLTSMIIMFRSLITCCFARNYMLHELRTPNHVVCAQILTFSMESNSAQHKWRNEKCWNATSTSSKGASESKREVNWAICLHDFMIYSRISLYGNRNREKSIELSVKAWSCETWNWHNLPVDDCLT